jgi:hypothetical protein
MEFRLAKFYEITELIGKITELYSEISRIFSLTTLPVSFESYSLILNASSL